MFRYIIVACVIFTSLCISAQDSTIRTFEIVGINGYRIEQYDKFEMILNLDADFDNPYDPDDIRIDATFTSPSGQTQIVAGFYYRDFEFSLTEEAQSLGWLESFSWRVRFTPTELGEWQVFVTATTPSDEMMTDTQTFIAVESDHQGFVRVSSDNPRYLAFDDGTHYFPIGLNMAWYGERRMLDYRDWLDALEAVGGNYIRVWLIHYGFGFEWLDTGLGTYGGRQDKMFELDVLVESLVERDMYMMLTFLTHTAYSLEVDSQWGSNPYNVANVGMLETPADFATHPEAIRLWKMQLRYIVARWGYSPNIMAWEWWNEVNWTELANTDLLVPWMEDSAEYLRELDPNKHLISHSGSTIVDSSVWNLPSIDFTQDHIYYVNDWVMELSGVVRGWRLLYQKPFLLAEYGYVDPPEFDPAGIRLHNGLWTAPMSGAMGTGMFWWWDIYIHLEDHYQHFAGVAKFFEDENLIDLNLDMSSASVTGNANVLGLQSLDYALLWIANRDYNDHDYREHYKEYGLPPIKKGLTDVQLTVGWLKGGTYQIEWWDTLTGDIIASEVVRTGGTIILDVPPFRDDIAVKIKPIEP